MQSHQSNSTKKVTACAPMRGLRVTINGAEQYVRYGPDSWYQIRGPFEEKLEYYIDLEKAYQEYSEACENAS
jgi:hypothetical protein